MPPTPRQTRWVVVVALCQVAAFALIAPFARIQLAESGGFIAAFEGIIFVTDLVTSVLLFSQFAIYRLRALLLLACAYLFAALIIIPHVLTYPGVFSPSGLLGAGLQTTGWLYWFWHLPFALALLAYGLTKGEKLNPSRAQAPVLAMIVPAIALVVALASGLTLFAIVGVDYLPVVFLDKVHATPVTSRMAGLTVLVCLSTIALLWLRPTSLLNQWLMIVALAVILEISLAPGLINTNGRFTLGFYAGRVFSLLSATIVLVVLLAETTRLHAKVARSEAALRELNETLDQRVQAETRERLQIWNVSQDLLVIAGMDGVFVSVNPAWTVALGWSESDLLGKSSQWLQHPDDVEKANAELDRLSEGHKTSHFEIRLRAKDGSYHWIAWTAVPDSGRIYAMGRDVTWRKQTEDEMLDMEQRLRRAQRLEAMGAMAGGIAHDFNNILGAIVGYGEMVLRTARPGTRLRRDVDAIMSAGERGRALIDRILSFSRSGVGERVPVHVESVVLEVLDQLAAKLPENVSIVPQLRAGRAAILGDATQVHQVVMNLVNNAVHAMPLGGALGVVLKTRRCDVAQPAMVGLVAPGDYIVLEVSDTGTGIAPEVLEHMFDPFFTTKEVGVGTGLGLSLVHGIVMSVRGAIDVATELGKGSTFSVYLPRKGDADEAREDEDQPLPLGDGQRVLIVDDEESLVRLAGDTLEELRYVPIGFTSSTRALQAFADNPSDFDAILTDERMPGVSGSMLISEVRRISPSIPIVLMSGFLGAAATRRVRDLGASDVLRKPLLARDLATSLARVLRT